MSTHLRQWQAGWGMLAVALALACTTARPAWADVLPSDPNAMAGWRGSVSLYDFVGARTIIYSRLRWIMRSYAPGKFDLSFAASDPSNGAGYVYAYQFFDAASPTSTEIIRTFSVGLEGDEQVANQGQLASPPGPAGIASKTPGFTNPYPTSAVWTYSSALGYVQPSQNSEILFFTSPFAPEWDFTSVTTLHGIGAQTPASGVIPTKGNAVPSPTPEPAGLLLLATAAGLIGLLGVVRRRCRG